MCRGTDVGLLRAEEEAKYIIYIYIYVIKI